MKAKKKAKTETVTTFQIRQGDVLVTDVIPPPAIDEAHAASRDDRGRVVLAAGEVTGHHHAIKERGVSLLRAEGVHDAVLTVGKEMAWLVHEEHGQIAIPTGRYTVRIQREWSDESSARPVQD